MKVTTLILGAGAAGLMCAASAGSGTLIIDHAKSPGEKIRISGGGRCNFTNLHTDPGNFLSRNPHFCKSALKGYSQWDFIGLVERHGIIWHEKTLGQLFCDDKSTRIVEMLIAEMRRAGAALWLNTRLSDITHDGLRFRAVLEQEGRRHEVFARNLVLATGGNSIPKMGATGMAHDIARQFGLALTETRPALVPLTFSDQRFAALAGVSLPVRAMAGGAAFDEALLFTHRGLSGPAILQISSYWREGHSIRLDLAPNGMFEALKTERQTAGRVHLTTALTRHLPKRLVEFLAPELHLHHNLADQSDARLRSLCQRISDLELRPSGSEGYRTAEVTLGGVDTAALNSRNMGAKNLPGLYVIGEAVDVTGWLGGYNFQWAWSSGYAAGTAIAAQAGL